MTSAHGRIVYIIAERCYQDSKLVQVATIFIKLCILFVLFFFSLWLDALVEVRKQPGNRVEIVFFTQIFVIEPANFCPTTFSVHRQSHC